jgi:hypothetical protein
MAKHIYKGTTIPAFTPPQAGHHYVNTATGEQYISKGNSSAADWVLLSPPSSETIQDTVGVMLTDTSSIDFTYNDAANQITATVLPAGVDHDALSNFVANEHVNHSSVSLINGTGISATGLGDITVSRTINIANTAVTAGAYGSATQVPSYTVNAQGQLTAAANVAISVPSTAITDFTEAVQDVIGGELVDSSSVDFQYNDIANTQSAVVLPAGVNHNLLQNYVVNEHINHSSVSISAGTGLTGGGDITSSRTLNIASTGVIASTYGNNAQVPQVIVNAQGQLTSATNVNISINAAQVQDFTEAAQDVVGSLLADSTSVDFAYNDAGNSMTASVLPAGVNHNALSNYVANEHINHSSVSITAGTGLTGGGDITANRTISMPNVGTAGTYGSGSLIPIITTDAQGRVSSITTSSVVSPWADSGGLLTWSDDTGKDLVIRQANAAESPYIRQVRSRGTVASPTAVLTGDRLGGNGYYGWNSTGVDGLPSVAFNGYATENHTSTAQGGELAIEIIPNGSTTPVTVATVQNDGLWNLQSKRITNAADPINANDYVTKQYVDNNGWTEVVQTSQLTSSSNTTLTNIGSLTKTVTAGKYYRIEAMILYRAAATTTGLALSIGNTSAVGTLSATANMTIAADGTASIYNGAITSFGDVVVSTGVPATGVDYIASIQGIFVCTTSGSITMQFRSEVNGSQVTVQAGSNMLVREW